MATLLAQEDAAGCGWYTHTANAAGPSHGYSGAHDYHDYSGSDSGDYDSDGGTLCENHTTIGNKSLRRPLRLPAARAALPSAAAWSVGSVGPAHRPI